jgi:hypothetical protein
MKKYLFIIFNVLGLLSFQRAGAQAVTENRNNDSASAIISKIQDEIIIYPNPAHEEVNIIYGADAGVKNIVIYNLIGKTVSAFKPIDNSSASLSIENLPTGIYFVRLIDAQGAVVATRKFTKQ